MGIIKLIGQLFQIVTYFLDVYKEKDKEKAAAKANLLKDAIGGAKETDPKDRASKLNMALDDFNRMRKQK